MNSFVLKHIILLYLISALYADAIEEEESCRIFYSYNNRGLVCVQSYEPQPPADNAEFTKVLEFCDIKDEDAKGLDMRFKFQYYLNGVCSLKPGDFLFLESHTELKKFAAQTRTAVLQSHTFYGICGLTKIILVNCAIEVIEPEAFACLKLLDTLGLNENKIRSLPKNVFKEMRLLQILSLYHNRIDAIATGTFDNLESLKELSLNGNLIFHLPEDVFSRVSSLENLFLHGNKLEFLSPLLISNLPRLANLSLSNNRLKNLSISFANNRNLRRMTISQNFDLKITADAFVGLENLDFLDMRECNFKYLPPGLFVGTPKLRWIYLNNNNLHVITDEIFSPLKDLAQLDLGTNSITELRKPFQHNIKLKEIGLFRNKLSVIGKDVFQGLSSLESLILSSNFIANISESSLNGLPNLKQLVITHNLLPSLRGNSSFQSILSNLTELQELYIGNNRIKYLKKPFVNNQKLTNLQMSENPLILDYDSFAGLKELHLLSLDKCNITSLPKDLFKNTPKLSQVDLLGNNLKEIYQFTFRDLEYLKELNIAFNNISILNGQPFKKQTNLISLNMSNNNISEIKKDDFEGLKSLIFLDISRNFVTHIENNSFDNMPNLEILKLHENLISTFSSFHPFRYNARLKEIDVSFNKLTDIWSLKLEHLKYLGVLKATNNEITAVLISETLLVPKASTKLILHLESNNIHHIYTDSEQIKSRMDIYDAEKTEIYLSGNPLLCDCRIYDLYELLNGSDFLPHVQFQDELICKYPAENEEKRLNELKPSDFTCNVTEDCPDRCICIYRAQDKTQSVNCSNQNYSNLPTQTPFNTSILYISKNNLTSLLLLNDYLWENLTEIYADDNKIESEEFTIPKKLKKFSLRNNKLKLFPNTLKKHTENMKDFKISILNNLWSCDCSLLAFKTWLLRHEKQVTDGSGVRCVFPNGSRSTASLMHTEDSKLCPIMYLYLYLIGVGIALLFASFLVFYYKYKLYILSFIYTHCNCLYTTFCCNRPSEEDKLFDCFISYSSEDRDVTLSILQELEVKPPHYKFCIHERNWMPGRYITNNIIVSVQSSRKTLIILSDTFLKSKWFQLEFQAAYQQTLQDKKDRLIIVLKGDLSNRSELNEDVAFVVSWKTYLVWGEKWFWEKLRKAIYEDTSLKIKQNKCTLESVLNCFSGKSDQNDQDLRSEDVSCETKV